MAARVVFKALPRHSGFPRLPQRRDTRGRTAGMRHDSAARHVEQIKGLRALCNEMLRALQAYKNLLR